MEFKDEDIRKLSYLARIKVNEEDMSSHISDLSKIVNFVEQLLSVDTDGVLPMVSTIDMTQRLREDFVNDGNYSDDVLCNTSHNMMQFFIVPKVVK